MILDRLLVREKLNLLVMIPLVMAVVLLVPLMLARITDAREHREVNTTAQTAQQVSDLVEQVQNARLLAIGYLDASLVSGDDVLMQYQSLQSAQMRVQQRLAGTASPQLQSALRGVGVVLSGMDAVIAKRVSDDELQGAFDFAVGGLIDALQLPRQAANNPSDAMALLSLDDLLRADEAASSSGALMLSAASNPVARPSALSAASVAQGVEERYVSAFNNVATPAAQNLFDLATSGPGAQRLADATAQVGLAGAAAPQGDVAQAELAAVQTQTTLRQLVEGTIARTVATNATTSATSALVTAALLLGIGVLLLGIVVWLSIAVGRSVSVPLRRLTTAAGSVADLTQAELMRVADEDAGPEAVPRLPAIAIRTRDEIGDLAAAFNRVQAAAAQLLERQVASRRNVALMFAGVGRRTTNLVGRQLALIDTLERSEENADTLRTLYRLDHVSTRLRRNASSLIVLSGEGEGQGEGWPLALPDAIRAALGSVEDFQRVTLTGIPDLHLAPAVVSDLVLLLAELIENAVLFSPPQAPVAVSAQVSEGAACTVLIVDQGIGMPQLRLAEENERLRQRERLDLAPTDVLGLFVVGRIARRHGIDVTLMPTPGRGLTARLVIPAGLFVDRPDQDAPHAPQAVQAVQAGPPEAAPERRPGSVRPILNRVPFPISPSGTRPNREQVPPPPAAPSLPPVPTVQDQPVGDRPAGLPATRAGAASPAWPAEQPDEQPRRRVPGTHWAAEAFGRSGAAGSGPSAPGLPAADGRQGARRPADPDAARRELEDVEAALAKARFAPLQTPHVVGNGNGTSKGAGGASTPDPGARPAGGANTPGDRPPAEVPPWEAPAWEAATSPWEAPRTRPGAPLRPQPPQRAEPPSRPEPPSRFGSPPASWLDPMPSDPTRPPTRMVEPGEQDPPLRLIRRVPGATLAGLEAAAPTPERRPLGGRTGIDADETLRAILDIDAAVERARSVDAPGLRTGDSGSATSDGGQARRGDQDGGQG